MNSFVQELTTRPLLLDGALATELEQAGCIFSISPLWSASTLLSQPEEIYQVHLDYFRAGANVAITASYQASTQGLELHAKLSHEEAINVIKNSVELAKRARTDYLCEIDSQNQKRALFVAGSIGPYGAFLNDGSEYRGDYSLPDGIGGFSNWHRPRMQALIEAGVDVLAIETIPSKTEALGLLKLLQQFPGVTAWMSFTLKDSRHISDGSSLFDIASTAFKDPKICAVGVNCISPDLVDDSLHVLSNAAKQGKKCIVVYPNSGEKWDSSSKTWSGETAGNEEWEKKLRNWLGMGAKLIGGCCRTGPNDVRAMRMSLTQLASNDEIS